MIGSGPELTQHGRELETVVWVDSREERDKKSRDKKFIFSMYETTYFKITCIVTHLNNVVKSELVDFFCCLFDKFKTRSFQTKT